MSKTAKIILIVFGFVIMGVGALMMLGMHAMQIEDTYGSNEDIFYNSEQGDLVVNRTKREFGEVRKNWTRFYVVRQNDTLDIGEWWNDKKIEIYRPSGKGVLDNIAYDDIARLKAEKKLELLVELR